ncbi:uncharacterized protein CCOS01_00685, partial [Colletotrichum costaricense]
KRAAPCDKCFLKKSKARPCSRRARERRDVSSRPAAALPRLRNDLKPEARQRVQGQALWASHGPWNGQPPAVRLMCCDRHCRGWETVIRSPGWVCELHGLSLDESCQLKLGSAATHKPKPSGTRQAYQRFFFYKGPDPNAPDGSSASLCQSKALQLHGDSFRDDCKRRVFLATGNAQRFPDDDRGHAPVPQPSRYKAVPRPSLAGSNAHSVRGREGCRHNKDSIAMPVISLFVCDVIRSARLIAGARRTTGHQQS